MIQEVQVAGRVCLIEYEKREGEIHLVIDGRSFVVDAASLPGGHISFLVDGRSYDVLADGRGDQVEVMVEGELFMVRFFDPRSRRPAAGGGRSVTEASQTIRAPMAGRIVGFRVGVDDPVREGDGLVVLEAMKMENELKSRGAGRVRELLVRENEVVAPGQPLMIIE